MQKNSISKEINNDEISDKSEKKQISKKVKKGIFGYSFWQILEYFIVYSILGYVIETLYGLLTKGVIESRQSMLYGPFCCIYGLGAICLLCIPKSAKKNNWTLFIAGFIIGSVVEYVVSWVGEVIFNIKWWDYSNFPLNINGRVCVYFSIFWGILTICLNKVINPTVDKVLGKVPMKILHVLTVIIMIFMAFDFIISSFALKMFETRLIYNYNLEVQGAEDYYEKYLDIYQNNPGLKKFVDKVFSDEKMLKTFPNIKFTLHDGSILLVKDILTDIKPYYIKVFDV